MNRAEFYFQRFTKEEVLKNRYTGNTDVHSWCAAIQRTYDKFLETNKLPSISYDARNGKARKIGHTQYPGTMLLTKAHVLLAEEILLNNGLLLDSPNPTPIGANMAIDNNLYITKDKEYVVRIGTNSSNEAVVEEKSTGRIFAIKPELLEKVLPYTVGVRFSDNATVYHYLSEVDQVQQDDILIGVVNGKLTLATVIGTNTKNESAANKLTDSFKGTIPFKKF
jgi:hypothetical protein